jgi:hypothetical protein
VRLVTALDVRFMLDVTAPQPSPHRSSPMRPYVLPPTVLKAVPEQQRAVKLMMRLKAKGYSLREIAQQVHQRHGI